jgi:hypothetical protein
MKFYKLDEIPILKADQVFRVSPTGKAIAAVVMYGIAIASLVWGMSGRRPSGMGFGFPYYLTGVVGLFGLIPVGMFRASLRPSAWLARFNDEGIIVKYRSYMNWRLPGDGVQAVGFEWREIAWAGLVKERRTAPSSGSRGGTEIRWLTYVDIGLANPDTGDLESHLQEEMNLRPDGIMVSLDYPVQTLPGGIVEISWSDGISPSAHKAAALLGRYVKIAEPDHRKVDLTHDRRASGDEERTKIILLARSGDEMGAVKLARQAFGYNLTQAHEYVEKVRGNS